VLTGKVAALIDRAHCTGASAGYVTPAIASLGRFVSEAAEEGPASVSNQVEHLLI
jgi:hypothetical protein